MKEEIVLIGGGGHCVSCIDVIRSTGIYKIIGILDKDENIGKKVLDVSIIGTDELIEYYANKNKSFLITIGQMKSFQVRKDIFSKIIKSGGKLPVIVSSTAYVSTYAKIDCGTIVMHRSFINGNVEIGKNSIINSGSIVEHDVIIGNNCHISTGCIINGNCRINEQCFIGSGSTIRNNIEICKNTVIGCNSNIVKDIYIEGTYFGNPGVRFE